MKTPFANATVVVASVVFVGVGITFTVIVYRGLTAPPYEVEEIEEPAPPTSPSSRDAGLKPSGVPEAPDASESDFERSEIKELKRPARLTRFAFNGKATACGIVIDKEGVRGAVVTKNKYIELDPLKGDFLGVPIDLSADGATFFGNSTRKDPNALSEKPMFGCVSKYEVRSAVRWDDFKPVPLGTLGGPNSEALGGTDDRVSVGWSEVKSGAIHAFIHSDGDGMRDLNPATYQSQAFAIDIRGDRQIVVGRVTRDDGYTWRACRWVNGQFDLIGPEKKSSAALGVSGPVSVGWIEEPDESNAQSSGPPKRIPAIWKEGGDVKLITVESVGSEPPWPVSSVADRILSDGTILIKGASSAGFFSLKSNRIRKLFGLVHR